MDITESNPMVQCCQCWFWEILPSERGCCHRHAPRPFKRGEKDDDYVQADWPVTDAYDGCGDGALMPESEWNSDSK